MTSRAQEKTSIGYAILHPTFGTVFAIGHNSATKVKALMDGSSLHRAQIRSTEIWEENGRWCSHLLSRTSAMPPESKASAQPLYTTEALIKAARHIAQYDLRHGIQITVELQQQIMSWPGMLRDALAAIEVQQQTTNGGEVEHTLACDIRMKQNLGAGCYCGAATQPPAQQPQQDVVERVADAILKGDA